MTRMRNWGIAAAAVLLAAACSPSSGGTSTTVPEASTLPTTSTLPLGPTITIFPTTTTTEAAPEPGSLEANRLLWESQGIERYRMTIETCGDFCVSCDVWVDGETVVEVPHDRERPHHMGFGDVGWLFDVVQGVPPEWLAEVEYDSRWGYPTLIRSQPSVVHGATLRVEELQPTDEPLPEYEYPAETYGQRDLRRQARGIDAVVEGTVLQRGDFTSARFPHAQGWVIEVDLDVVWYQRAGTPPLVLGATEVIDPVVWSGLRPHALLHREGERIIFLLSAADDTAEGAPAWYASWALQRTDQGLDFLGFFAERYRFDADLPELCTRGPSGEPRDADRELALLVHWAEEFDRLGPGEPARLALRRACAADDLLLEW